MPRHDVDEIAQLPMKPGRNDPCPCGSGKKYKHCCLAKEVARLEDPDRVRVQRIERWQREHNRALLDHISGRYGAAGLREAWQAFMGAGPEEDFDPDSPHAVPFVIWMQHRWAPDPATTRIEDASLHGVRPTRHFLDHTKRRIDPLFRAYLEACIATPLAFYEVVAVARGVSMTLRDVFAGDVIRVLEDAISRRVRPGDILFAQVVRVGEMGVFEALSSTLFQPEDKVGLIKLRRELRTGVDGGGPFADDEREREARLRQAYVALLDETHQPRDLRNADGEPLAPTRLTFAIDSPQAAFDALHHLDGASTRDELLEHAERDRLGALRVVAFDWTRPGHATDDGLTHTTLGELLIEGDHLYVEVNSGERAAAIEALIR